MLYLAFEIQQMFLRSLMELSYASFPEEGKNAVLKQLFLFLCFSLFLSLQTVYVFSERENSRLYPALTFTSTW